MTDEKKDQAEMNEIISKLMYQRSIRHEVETSFGAEDGVDFAHDLLKELDKNFFKVEQ